MVRFESAGLTVSIMTFVDVSFCVTLNSLPAPSYAVMLNATGPFGKFCKTEMFANAVIFDSVMFISVPRISKVALWMFSDTSREIFIKSPALASDGSELLL